MPSIRERWQQNNGVGVCVAWCRGLPVHQDMKHKHVAALTERTILHVDKDECG